MAAICSPTVNAGSRLVIGSWKIIARRSPRRRLIERSDCASRSMPSRLIEPELIRPGGVGINPMIASEVTDFPHPDSPTRPRTSPAATSNETPFTTRAIPVSVAKSTERSRTESRAGAVM